MDMSKVENLWRRRKGALLLCSFVIFGFAGFGAFRLARPAPLIPSALVQRGEFTDYVQLHGQAKALKSTIISAPYQAGDLQIIKLAQNGTQVKKDDVVVQFDATTLKQTLAQDQSTLKSSDAEIQAARAQARLKEEQDLTDVMKARFDVQSAKLDASKSEILSKIDGEEADLKLADAQQKLKEMEEKLKADRDADAATIESKQQKRDQALYEVRQTNRGLDALTLRAPTNGIVTLQDNWRAAGPMGNAAPFKPGDRAWPGAEIAELPDLSTLEISARLDETERGRIQAGQTANVHIDAIPDRDFTGRISQISTIASMDFSAGWPFPRNFTMDIVLSHSDSRLRPGMSANVHVIVDQVPNGITIPAAALFRKAGQSVVYVLHGTKVEQRPIEVSRRSGDQILIAKGLQPGERVALQEPAASD
ncbi:MAG TPA: efflux RND transporter periplasmic adaptor subunit [Candidatus Acidoferrales bacterium]|nr:efflux RND transporter periplasmic adaptor subunit [Candidatus Acidoferrales bacterium]